MSRLLRPLLIILIFSSTAEASNWQPIHSLGAENYGFYVDFGSVRRLPNNKVRFWYTVAKTLEEAKKDTYRSHYIEMNCLQKRFRDITYEQEKAPVVWENIAPDSFQEAFYGTLCRKKE